MTGGNIRSNNKSFEAWAMEEFQRLSGLININTNIDNGNYQNPRPVIQKSFKDYLNLNQGGVLASSLGWNASKVTISSGSIDIGRASGKLSGHVIVSAESGTADILTDINNQVFGYQDLTIQANTTDTITINTTGNINLGNGVSSLTLNPGEQLRLRYDTISNSWRVFLGASSGGGGTTFPIDFPEDDRGTVGASTQVIDFTQSDRHAVIMTMSGDIGISLTNTTANKLQITTIKLIQDGTGSHVFTGFSQSVTNEQAIIDAVDTASGSGEFVTFIVQFLDGLFTAFLENSNVIIGGSAGYDLIQDEGIDLTKRQTINFIGTGVLAVDNIGNGSTDVTISGIGATNLGDLSDVSVGGAVLGQSLIYDGAFWTSANVLLSTVTIDADKSWVGKNITDMLSLGSNATNLPGSGFIRMGTAEEIRMRNPANTDDLIITSGQDAASAQAIIFKVASGNQLTISETHLDIIDNGIINTGDITPGSGSHQVGDSTDFYNQMHSQFFVPEAATIIPSRYGLSKVGNRPYINYDDTNADAGFGIYEEGLQMFKFSNPTSLIRELFIGHSPHDSGETYRIQLGENSNASAKIEFTEGANDLFIDRLGVSTNQSVALSTRSQTRFKVNVNEAQFFVPANLDGQDMINVVDIKSDGGGGATTGTIGELITNNGGFNYFMRDTLAWESDSDVKLTFGSGGITLETNGTNDNIDILAQGTSSDVDVRAAADGELALGRIGANHMLMTSTFTRFQNENLLLENGAQEIQFLDAIANASVSTPAADDITLFNDLTSGELSVKKSSGSIVSLEASASGESNTASNLGVTTFGLFAQKIGVDLQFKSLIAGTNVTLSQTGTEVTINGDSVSAYDTIQDEGSAETQRTTLNFIGSAVSVADNAGQLRTDVTITSAGLTGVNNVGSATGEIFRDIVTDEINLKTLAAGAFISITNNVDTITIASTGLALNDISDVSLSTPATGDTLIYDSGAGLWKNQTYQGYDYASQKITDPTGGQFGSAELYYSARMNGNRRYDPTGTPSFFETSPAVDLVFFVPIVMGKNFTVTQLAYYADTAVGSTNVSYGLYESDPETLEPTSLIVSQSNQVMGSDLNESSTFNVQRDAGVYYLALKMETNPAPGSLKIRAIEPDAISYILGTDFNEGPESVICYTGEYTTTGLPGSFASTTNKAKLTSGDFSLNFGTPEVFVKVSVFGV